MKSPDYDFFTDYCKSLFPDYWFFTKKPYFSLRNYKLYPVSHRLIPLASLLNSTPIFTNRRWSAV